nr:hypothetical protein Z957_p0162 [Clostridium sp. K25]KEI08032.1 hypothetical protein Z958_p0110 [Clostridium novyi B str. NCTC 9691]
MKIFLGGIFRYGNIYIVSVKHAKEEKIMKEKILKLIEECNDGVKLDLILYFIEKILKK